MALIGIILIIAGVLKASVMLRASKEEWEKISQVENTDTQDFKGTLTFLLCVEVIAELIGGICLQISSRENPRLRRMILPKVFYSEDSQF